jgi:hypothetical protein
MSEVQPQDVGGTRTLEVRVYRRGELIHRELCESEEQASLAVEEWGDLEEVVCDVEDLSPRHADPEPAAELELAASSWEAYPQVSESPPQRFH